MISFDTFSGPSSRVRERELEDRLRFHAEHLASGLAVDGTKQQGQQEQDEGEEEEEEGYATAPEPENEDDDDGDDDDVFYESQDEEFDLFHEHPRHPPRRKEPAPSDVSSSSSASSSPGDLREEAATSRIQQLVRLLTDARAHDARSALVHKLLGSVNISELVLSKATEEQIALAADEAIADEILANVDLEEKRRQSLSQQDAPTTAALDADGSDSSDDAAATASTLATIPTGSNVALFLPGQYSPFRVLELVDVLDSTTGGMVKRVLTKVRRRAPFGQRFAKDMDKSIEFCRFCSAYSDHTSLQHRCRLCGLAGHHRSRNCPRGASSVDSAASASPSSALTLPGDKNSRNRRYSYCTFCANWGLHSTERHRCRLCSAHGQHRSRNCPQSRSPASGRGLWRGSPVESLRDRKYCELCGSWRLHRTTEHRCRICGTAGDHRSQKCPQKLPPPSKSPAAMPSGESLEQSSASQSTGSRTPRAVRPSTDQALVVKEFCRFCSKKVTHRSDQHICRVCRAVGTHRSGDCPERQSVLSYSVEKASKVRDRVLEKIPLVLPPAASALVYQSLDKMGDVDMILKKTLQRIGVWGGGSQTPITTPYAPPMNANSSSTVVMSAAASDRAMGMTDRRLSGLLSPSGPPIQPYSAGVYVLSYAEGSSVVPERILKYMRLLMHHEVSTNAFSVIVRFDPRSSHWELDKPGMVTPRSLPSSPTMSRQLKKRMAKYTMQTLLGAREKLLVLLAAEQRKAALLSGVKRLDGEAVVGRSMVGPMEQEKDDCSRPLGQHQVSCEAGVDSGGN